MKIFVFLVIAGVMQSAGADSLSHLCGDPPPVANDSLKGDLEGKASFLRNLVGDANLKGNIETTRVEIFSKYPNADKLVVDHYMVYQACILLMSDNTLDTPRKLEELRKMRTEYQSVSGSQRIAKTCRHSEFGREKWGNSEVINQSSGWVGGGSNPTNWCNQLIGQIISNRRISSNHNATVLKTSEEGRWTGWHGRTRQYNYHCSVRMEWNPIYREKQDASRCGEI